VPILKETAINTLTEQSKPQDGGPIYAETDLSAFIAEPWNAISSLAILFPAIYWAVQLRKEFGNFKFLYACIPFLFLGGLGSTLFHAFRASRWFLLMDVLPTAILTMMVSIYFWIKILAKWGYVLLIVLPITGLRIVIFQFIDPPASINISYFLTGIMIFFPMIILLRKTHMTGIWDIVLSVGFLALALVFRERDLQMVNWLYMGTHFLWHLSSGVGAFFLARYLFKLRKLELDHPKDL